MKKFKVTLVMLIEGDDSWTEQDAISEARRPDVELLEGSAEELN